MRVTAVRRLGALLRQRTTIRFSFFLREERCQNINIHITSEPSADTASPAPAPPA